jgi:Protein of unknown function (DUF1493)
VQREKLTPGTTLSHDLGMEGDDAVEFFEDFAAKFTVDLRLLGENWNYYFDPEGLGLVGSLLVVVPTLAIGYVIRLILPMVAFWMSASLAFVALDAILGCCSVAVEVHKSLFRS